MPSAQHTLLHHLAHSRDADPHSQALAFRLGGLETLNAMEKIRAQDGEDSASSGSVYSDLSALENETDEFGRRLLQHQREVRGEMRPRQAFRKARPLQRGAVVAEETVEEARQRGGSAGSEEVEPPLHLPKQWGTKAKKRNDWLRKLHAPTEDEVPLARPGSVSPSPSPERKAREMRKRDDEDRVIPLYRTSYTGDDGDWVAVDDAGHGLRAASSPTSLRHLNTTLGNGLEPEGDDQDFTAADLAASTPAAAAQVNRRDRHIDQMTRRELTSIEQRGVTKRNLDHILSSSNTSPSARPATAPSAHNTVPRRRRSLIANKENLPPRDVGTPERDINGYGAYKAVETVELVNRSAEAVRSGHAAQRPVVHKRNDSYHLLKRLARVSSLSPSPAKVGKSGAAAGHEEAEDGGRGEGRLKMSAEVAATSPLALKVGMDRTIPDVSDGDAELEMDLDVDLTPPFENASSLDDAKTPVVTGAWLDTPKPGINLRPLLQSTDSTIVRAFGSPSAIATLEPQGDPMDRRVVSEPAHARSALADVLNEVRKQQAQGDLEEMEDGEGGGAGGAESADERLRLGETTIQSLEDIVHPHYLPYTDESPPELGDITHDLAAALDEGADPEGEVDEAAMTQAQRDRRQEKLAMEAMDKHLRAAHTSIRDASRGLRRVEHRIEDAVYTPMTPTLTPEAAAAVAAEVGKVSGVSFNDARHLCPTCGGHSSPPATTSAALRTLWEKFSSLFYTTTSHADPRPHPRHANRRRTSRHLTWLGLTVLTCTLWYTLESALCARYCHPRFAERMVGYGVDPNAPRWPFVLLTLVSRALGLGVVGGGAWKSLRGWWVGAKAEPVVPAGIFRRAGGQGVREEATRSTALAEKAVRGGSAWVRTTSTVVAAATRRVVGSLGEAVDEVGSMWDDEFVR
ncbi:hypothetical protein LTR53_010900 [Teratosphaeriaceae sp. CCFEE 6253]|nr:hypothetical protein LTR53_010900 [Teratosphaeriaceae sp. CCFEE 6253]